MQRERKLQLLRQTLKQPGRRLANDEYAFFCPKHGARSDRVVGQLSINISTDKFHCWSCGYSGKNLSYVFQKDSHEWREYVEELPSKEVKEPEKKFDSPTLPEEFRTMSKDWNSPYYNAAVSYLRSRGIGRREILKWKLGYCESGPYKNRIIIPSFDELGFLNFVTGRAFYEGVPRYMNGNFSKDIIFNDYMIDWKKPVVITEGPFDAIKADENAVSLQGSFLDSGSKLASKIVFSDVEVLFAMDQDAFNKQLKIIKELMSYGVRCKYVPLNGKSDVGEMTIEEFKDAKKKSVPVNSDLDILKLRISL